MAHAYAATTFAFAVNVFAAAFAARTASALRGGVGARLLSGVMIAVSAVVLLQIAAFVREFLMRGMLLAFIPFVIGPSLVWIAVLLKSAWMLNRAGPASSAGPAT